MFSICYLEWWGDRPKGNGSGQNKVREGSTNGRGRGKGVRANAARATSMDEGGTSGTNNSNSPPGISQDQCKILMEMLKTNNKNE